MNKENINRENLKNNFLKQTILRIDYDFLFPNYIMEVIEKLDQELKDDDYRIENSVRNDYNLDLTPSGMGINQNQEKVFTLINNDNSIVIEVTKNFSCIIVNYINEYKDLNDILEIFMILIDNIKDVRNNIKFTRLGLRKTNSLLVENINVCNDIFEKELIDFIGDKDELVSSRKEENYLKNDRGVNYLVSVQSGQLEKDDNIKDVFQIVYDIDNYVISANNVDVSLKELKNLNLEVFDNFKKGIKVEFLEKLINSSIDEINQEGVYLVW